MNLCTYNNYEMVSCHPLIRTIATRVRTIATHITIVHMFVLF